jgi:hypothetical protein
MKLLIVSPASCPFIFFQSKYFPQHPQFLP